MELSLRRLKMASTIYVGVTVFLHVSLSTIVTIPDYFDEDRDRTARWASLLLSGLIAVNVIVNFRLIFVRSTPPRPSRDVGSTSSLVGDDSSRPSFSLPTAWCSACSRLKPPRAHHCKICDRCVPRRDHHCFVVGECVGASNVANFVLFLLHCCFGLCFSLSFAIAFVRRRILSTTSWTDLATRLLFPVNVVRLVVVGDVPASLVPLSLFLEISALNCLVTLCYGALQFYLVLADMTWHEWRSGSRTIESGEGGRGIRALRSLRLCFGRRWYLTFFCPWMVMPFFSTANSGPRRIKEI